MIISFSFLSFFFVLIYLSDVFQLYSICLRCCLLSIVSIIKSFLLLLLLSFELLFLIVYDSKSPYPIGGSLGIYLYLMGANSYYIGLLICIDYMWVVYIFGDCFVYDVVLVCIVVCIGVDVNKQEYQDIHLV